METKLHFQYFIFFIVLFVFISIPLIADGYSPNPLDGVWCFSQSNCDTSGCPLNLFCPDDQPGYNVTCEPDWNSPCPQDAICFFTHEYGEKCGYVEISPTYRHENCCDNWGWNNVRRCGGCCGVAANCVGYVN